MARPRPQRTSPSPADRRRTGRWRVLATAALVLAVALAGCSERPPELKPDRPAEELYNTGMDLLTSGDRIRAAQFFDEVERQHPYSVWANKAVIMAAYSRYQMGSYDDAVIGLDRFIRLHPGSPDIAYVYYLRALCYYERIADIQRDQGITRRATEALQEVMRRFPDTKFAQDAKLKLDLTRDQLAGQEMAVGRWYQGRGEYAAAINRFKKVVDDYQTTSHVPEALHRMTECFLALGLVQEAIATAAVLGHNFPGSEWYIDSYALMTGEDPRKAEGEPQRRSWLGRAWNSVF